jgi:hypothetical protein
MSGEFMAGLSDARRNFSVSLARVLGVFAASARGTGRRAFGQRDGTLPRTPRRYIDLTQRREKFLLLG